MTFLMESQNWDSIRGGVFQSELQGSFYDSIHDKLIVSGRFFSKVGSLPARGVCSWDGSRWDSLAGGINTHDAALNPNNPSGVAACGIPYNGKLLVGGLFASIGGVNASSLATWDGSVWDSLPVRAFKFSPYQKLIAGMYRYNNLIYVYGSFDTIAGQPAQGLATWDGTSFQVINLPIRNDGHIFSMTVYKNEIYLCGNFSDNNLPTHFIDMMKYNGSAWVELGSGIKGNLSGVYDMAIYNDTLFVGGWIFKADGNAGDLVMKWDGNQWYDAGFDGAQYGSVNKFLVYHNKLWALGNYDYGAYMTAYRAASYDGSKWCALHDSVDNGINAAVVYHDTIYIAGGFASINQDSSIAYLAKLKNPNYYSACNATGINESSSTGSIKIYPNPVTAILNIVGGQNELQNASVEISSSIGQIVLKRSYSNTIDVSGLSPGCYVLKVISYHGESHYAKFIRHD